MKNPDTDRLHPDDWDDHFRQRFADFQSEPPANALARILAELPTPAPAFNRRRTWFLGGLGLFLLLVSSWFVHYSWPLSTQLTANSPQGQRQSERVKTKKPDVLNTVPPRSVATESSVIPDNPDQEVASSDNSDKNVPAANKRVAPLKNEGDEGAMQNQHTTKSSKGSFVPERAKSSLEDFEAVQAVESKRIVSASNKAISRNTVATKIPSSGIDQHAIDLPKTTVKTRTSQSTGNTDQPTDKQPISAFKSANKSVGTMAEENPMDDKRSNSTTSLPKESQLYDPQQITPEYQQISLAILQTQPMHPTRLTLQLPDISLSALPQSAPKKPEASRQRPTFFIGVMPLYTYQRIDPVQTDDIWVKNVTTQRALSTQRAGLRLQTGIEWPITRRISLRTSLIYNQLNQKVSYSTPTDQPDSVRVERVDDKTVRLIPYYHDKQVNRQTNWHYVGVGADFVFHLGKLGAWRHYLSAGATAGTYISQGANKTTRALSGFIQGAYGIERPLTSSVWLRLAPTVQYGLTTVSDADGLFLVRPYTYGLTIGLRK